MLETILVPLDGSELAEIALSYVKELASRIHCDISLICVDESKDQSYRHMYMAYLNAVAQKLDLEIKNSAVNSAASSVKINKVLVAGHAAESIIEYAEKYNIGLIVMCTHGRSGLKRWALGSVANKVLTSTTRPITLIRAQENSSDVKKNGKLNKILVPLDGSEQSEVVLPYIEVLAAILKPQIVLLQTLSINYNFFDGFGYTLTTYTGEQTEQMKNIALDYLQTVGKHLQKKGVSIDYAVKYGAAATEIINFADEINADLIVMATHGQSGIGRWIFGSTAARVLKAGNTPLMVIRSNI